MLSFAAAVHLAKAGLPRPRKFKAGQFWFTPEGRLGVVIRSAPDYVLLQFSNSAATQYNFRELIYAPTLEEIFDAIAHTGKHRLLSKPPYGDKFEVVSITLHQYITGRRAANILAKEFCRIVKSG